MVLYFLSEVSYHWVLKSVNLGYNCGAATTKGTHLAEFLSFYNEVYQSTQSTMIHVKYAAHEHNLAIQGF